MNDFEMIKFAAKAAGIDLKRDPNGVIRDCTGMHPAMNIFAAPEWKPLQDDGDALRLAVKLKLQVTPGTYKSHEATVFHAGLGEAHEHVHYQQDIYAATRRAIVRVAAEIGERME